MKRTLAVCMTALLWLTPVATAWAEEAHINTYSDDIIASGKSENITWSIDANGKLMVEGTGDCKRETDSGTDWPFYEWQPYAEQIKSAEIQVSGTTDASFWFLGCSNLISVELSGFDTSSVTNMGWMFDGCSSLSSVDLSGFDTSSVTDMRWMFSGCSSLSSLDLSCFDTSSVTRMDYMFSSCSGLSSVDLSGFDTSSMARMDHMFSGCSSLSSLDLSDFDTSSVADMGSMFYGCRSLSSLDLSGFNTSSVTNMSSMFCDCSSLSSLDLSGFDTSSVTSMRLMFEGCSSLSSVNLSGFNTSSVTNMSSMFSGCSSLSSMDLSGFDTSNVTDMWGMFDGCSSLSSVNLSGFDTSSVRSMQRMFDGCSSLSSVDLSSFDTSRVRYMSDMFYGCSSLSSLDLSGFDTSMMFNMYVMSGMIDGCSNLTILKTPRNLYCIVQLPKDEGEDNPWYMPDGTIVTELPQKLAESVTLTRKRGTDQTPDPNPVPEPSNWLKGEDGREYWYEDGVRQGYDPDNPAYRGKEIYDPASDAWYWLDNVQQGAKAVSKDVYQESTAGLWAENEDGTGKWVRYDAEGHMIKGWNTNEDGTYYFDLTYGTMAKGTVTIDGSQYHFDEASGLLTGGPKDGESGSWESHDGTPYWYEGGVRQGYDPRDAAYRGKEIYDPTSDAWYWLDNVQQGAKAVSKDVYQESAAGEWAENEDGTGKWVRYDADGHMVKGWSENEDGTYYFDLIYGTMAKGTVIIDGKEYRFDEVSGILQ